MSTRPQPRPADASSSPSSRASIINVAAIANVSTATVSRVLSGKRTKNDDIDRRVRAAAAKLDYSVNAAASALRSNTATGMAGAIAANTVALVARRTNDSFVAQLIDALEPMIAAAGRQLSLSIGGTRALQARHIAAMTAPHIGGLIVVATPGADLTDILEHPAQRIPIVQIGGAQRPFLTSMVTLDHGAAIDVALRHLAATGVRSAAYLPGDAGIYDSAALNAAFHAQAAACGLTVCETDGHEIDGDGCVSGGVDDGLTDAATSSESATRRGFDHVMMMYGSDDGRERPRALLCHDDAVALGAMHALAMLRLRVPQDVSVISYGDSPLATAAIPRLTAVRPPVRQIAAEALRLLAANATGVTDTTGIAGTMATNVPTHVSLPSLLVVRESTPARADQAV